MKKLLFLLLIALTALCTKAEFNRLVFHNIDGKEQSIGLTDLNIIFADGKMIAGSAGESVIIELSALKSMEFSNNPTGIPTVIADNLEGRVTVYGVMGQRAGEYESAAAAYAALPAGVYILKTENGRISKMMINR